MRHSLDLSANTSCDTFCLVPCARIELAPDDYKSTARTFMLTGQHIHSYTKSLQFYTSKKLSDKPNAFALVLIESMSVSVTSQKFLSEAGWPRSGEYEVVGCPNKASICGTEFTLIVFEKNFFAARRVLNNKEFGTTFSDTCSIV